MIREHIPKTLGYGSAWARPEWQGALLSCTRFGLTGLLEFMAARAGLPEQFAVRFLWWFTDNAKLSIESAVDTLNRVGVCADHLCPYVASMDAPYVVKDIDVAPGLEALLDAQARGIRLKTASIAGRVEVMRALAQGWGVVSVRTLPGGVEHAECLIDYDVDLGVLVYGSAWSIYWEPWESLDPGGCFTQLHRAAECTFEPVPHPDYVEGDQPSFENGVLSIPEIKLFGGYGMPNPSYCGVRAVFTDYGQVTANDPNASQVPVWFAGRRTLSLPTLLFNGQRYKNVILVNPQFSSFTGEIVNA